MNRTTKVILVIISSLLAICLCIAATGFIAVRSAGWVLGRAFETDPESVAQVGDDIAGYDLPAGFGSAHVAQLAGFSLVSYTGADGHSHIMLFQAPQILKLDQAELERQMRTASGKDAWTELTVVERQPCQIRGEQTTLVISEGNNHDGQRYRSASALFTGEGGPALVNLSTPADSWDQETVDAFIDSLR